MKSKNTSPGGASKSIVPEPAHLTIDAHVVVQLGAELITDPEQALLELIKNSYDADSEWCTVSVQTSHVEMVKANSQSSASTNLVGRICIEDNGHGMAGEQIRRGWLSISLSLKREAKRTGELTKKFKRYPMGDKGLGRVSSMRLGDLLRVTTHHSADLPGTEVWFRWSDCRSGIPLDEVPVWESEVPKIGRTGTKVEIVGLHDLTHWKYEDSREKLQAKMSTMVSPFKQFRSFIPSVTVDGSTIDLVDLNTQVLKVALSHFTCNWTESARPSEDDPLVEEVVGEIALCGHIKMDFFRGKDSDSFDKYVRTDKGEALLKFLKAEKFTSQYSSFAKDVSGDWYLSFKVLVEDLDIPWGDTAKKGRRAQKSGATRQSSLFLSNAEFPGPFESELYGYSYDDETFQNLLAGTAVNKQFIQELSGVAIFRDGFRVRTGNDWLRLADSFTSGASFYGLRPRNVLGFVALTSQFNAQLKETSNRENFVDNKQWKTFYTLMLYFRDFANSGLTDLRRAYTRFLESRKPVTVGTVVRSPAEALAQISDLEKASALQRDANKRTREAASAAFQATETSLARVRSAPLDTTTAKLADELQAHIAGLKVHINDSLDHPQDLHEQLSTAGAAASLIREKFAQVAVQIEEVYEHVAIGLAAQGVVHDVHGLIEEILGRLSKIEAIGKECDPPIARKIERDVSSTKTLIRLIGKQLGTLNPMLRQYRERKEEFAVIGFLREFFELRSSRYEELGINVHLPSTSSLVVSMNKGRLTQILDNLARNSEYWLMDNVGRDLKITPAIHVELSGQTMSFWDTGRGIRPAMEGSLFDLFVTDKPREQGQGLGLFIVRELLRFENCSIALSAERNSYRRLYKFEVDLGGVANVK